jgi:predicted nucleic acid-binding protein
MYLLDTNVVSELRKAKTDKMHRRVHVLPTFQERVLAVDTTVAQRCATLHVPNPPSDRDALIAATALVHGLTVVTRNVEDFEPTGVAILDPWQY